MEHSYRSVLMEKFQEKSLKNPAYKMSAFARDLGISQSRLTEVLKGKQGLSRQMASQICQRLRLSSEESELFCLMVAAAHGRSQKERDLARVELMRRGQTEKTHFLNPAEVPWVRWYHFAILSFFETCDDVDAAKVASKFRITFEAAEQALADLLKQNLILQEKTGLALNTQRIESLVFSGVTPKCIQELNIDLMEKSKKALVEDRIEERQIGSTILALNKNELMEFKNMLRDFRRKIEERASEMGQKNAVYNFSFQFFELK